MTTPIAGLPEISENQANKAITHNTALRQLEINLGAVISRTLTTPPSSPAEGALYIVPSSATGAWGGQTNKIAQWSNGGWNIYNPFQYQRLYSIADSAVIIYVGTSWSVFSSSGGGSGDMVKSTYDTDNDGIVDNAESVVDGAITTTKIANSAVTYAKIQNVTTNRLLGRVSAGSGDTEEITIGSGLSITGTTLSATGGSSVTDGDKGDIIVSNSSAIWTIDNDAVTFPKIQNIATNRLLGRSSASSGDIEEITVGSGLNLSTGTLSVDTLFVSLKDFISGHIERASNKIYCLDLSVKRSYIINNLSIVCDSGSVSGSLQLNTTSVTGINSFTVNQSLLTLNATANNTASIGSQLNLVLSSNNNALDVKFTLEITYA